MNNLVVNSNPFVIAPSGDTANFAENQLCVIGSGAGVVVLPLISSLRSGDMTIYLQASGGAMTVQAQGGNNIIEDTKLGTATVAAGTAKVATAVGLTTWFIR